MLWLTVPVALLAGAFTWSFSEYAIHNWGGHKAKGKNEFSREHLAHHADTDHFTDTPKKIVVAVAVTAIMLPVTALLLGLFPGLAFTIGFMSAYVSYEVVHRRIHTHPPTNFYGRWARKHHYYHHFCRPNLNHGLTSPIWDVVFGTYVNPEIVRVPEKKAMSWLIDPETGDVYAYLADDYELARRGSRRRKKTTAQHEDASNGSLAPAAA